MTNAITDQQPAADADFLIKDDQLSQAHTVNAWSESAFYGQHDRDEMEMIALNLGIHLDDLRIVNKTTLRTAIFAQAEHNILMGGKERSKVAAQKSINEWPAKMLSEALAKEEAIREEGQRMGEKPYQSTDHWRLERLAEAHAELDIRFELVRIFFEMKNDEWVRRVTVDIDGNETERETTLEDVRRQMHRDVLQQARYGSSRSTSQLSNQMDDMKNSARAKILEDLQWLLRSAADHDIVIVGSRDAV